MTMHSTKSIIKKIMVEADLDDDNQLSFAEFEHVISKAPDFLNSFRIRVWNGVQFLQLFVANPGDKTLCIWYVFFYEHVVKKKTNLKGFDLNILWKIKECFRGFLWEKWEYLSVL